MIVFELSDDLPAGVEMAGQVVRGAPVLVGDGDLQVVGGGIRIPVGEDVEPCVQRRDDRDAHRHHQGDGIAQDTREITQEYSPDGPHSAPLFL